MNETLLIVTGVGTAAFMLALCRIVTAEADRAMAVHRLRVEAMQLRNSYARTILSLRSPADQASESPSEATPAEEPGAIEPPNETPRQAA